MNTKPNLYLIFNKSFRNWEDRLVLLEQAAQKLDIHSIRVDAEHFDYSSWQEIPATKKDMFYNLTPFSHDVENIFIHKGLTSFFIAPNKINHLFSTHQFDLSLINAGIRMPKTILNGTSNRELLHKYVDYLGGFPLIVKATGGSTGIGVIKVDSWDGLISTADLLVSKRTHFQLKEFIENEGTIRVIVVGKEVITSVMRKNLKDDFRVSGNNLNNFLPVELPVEQKQICIRALESTNFEFGGLDLILNENNEPFILEVNYPNNFAGVTHFNGHDIAYEALSYLLEKSKK